MVAKPIYSLLLAVALPAVLGSGAAEARKLGGTWSKGSIKAHCDAAGGSFSSSSKGYGCLVSGTASFVDCNNKGKCTGSDPIVSGNPGRAGPARVEGIGAVASGRQSAHDGGPQQQPTLMHPGWERRRRVRE